MARVQKRTISLTEAQAAFIDRKVAAGEYASVSEVVRDGLRDLMEYDAALEKFMRTEVLEALREYEADPSSARPADEVFAELLAEMRETKPSRKRA